MTPPPAVPVTAARTAVTIAALALVTAQLIATPGRAYAADPAGCTRDGTRITCTNGVPKGETLAGTGGDDTIEITGTVYGTVDGGAGDDIITVRGQDGANGTPGTSPSVRNGATGRNAVTRGVVLGGPGNDVITLVGGRGGDGARSYTPSHFRGVTYQAGHGGGGGAAVAGGIVEGGRGNNLILLKGGKGGTAGADPGPSKKLEGYPGMGASGLVNGSVTAGVDRHSSVSVVGGDGGEGSTRHHPGAGGFAVLWGRSRVDGGASPEGATLTLRGGSRGRRGSFVPTASGGSPGLAAGSVDGTPGNDDIRVESGENQNGQPSIGGIVAGKVSGRAGDDTITVGSNSGTVDCGSGGNDTYTYTGRRGVVVPRTCEHITRSR